jgi:hypothetical protein
MLSGKMKVRLIVKAVGMRKRVAGHHVNYVRKKTNGIVMYSESSLRKRRQKQHETKKA